MNVYLVKANMKSIHLFVKYERSPRHRFTESRNKRVLVKLIIGNYSSKKAVNVYFKVSLLSFFYLPIIVYFIFSKFSLNSKKFKNTTNTIKKIPFIFDQKQKEIINYEVEDFYFRRHFIKLII